MIKEIIVLLTYYLYIGNISGIKGLMSRDKHLVPIEHIIDKKYKVLNFYTDLPHSISITYYSGIISQAT